MNKEDKHFIEGYEKLLNKGYCNCNELNCIDNNSPRRILNIVNHLKQENKEQEEYITYWQKETDKRQDKIDKAIEYLINQPKKIWEGHSIDEVVKILKGEDDE